MPQNKPTKEELEQKEAEAIKVAEELEEKGNLTIPEEPEEETPEVPEEPEEEVEEEVETPEEPEEEAEPSKELYKRKYSESSRENQKIYAKNRVINKALADAEDVAEPTEEELASLYFDYDLASDVEKHLIKETEITKRWRNTIASAKEQATKIEKWNESVNEFVSDPKVLSDNPDLEGKTDEFSEFAKTEANNNVPFNVLVGAFLHEQSKNKPVNKGKMFERGSGGPNDNPRPKNGMLTLEEARELRESNYDLWKEKLKEGKIEINI